MNYRFTAMLMAALLSLCVLGGCKIDVNELAAESSSENESSSPFYSAPDTDTAVFPIPTRTYVFPITRELAR